MDNQPVVTVAPESQAPSKDDRTMAIIAHLAPLAGYLVAVGQILVPLAIYLFGPSRPYVRAQAKEALNAQISFTAYWAVVVFMYATIILIPIAIPATLVLGIGVIWTMVAAAIAASEGKAYRYPGIFRLI